ncbi:MAG: DMT family transporter [Pseudomonadota bacterium]
MTDQQPPTPRQSGPSRGPERIGLGIGAALCAVFLFAVTDAVVKDLSERYSAFQIVFFRYLFGLIPVTAVVWYAGGLKALRTRRLRFHMVRACLLFVALTSFFAALKELPLAEAIATAFTAPLFVAALSGPVLGEKVGPRRWGAVAAGFVGAIIIIRPGTEAFQPATLLVLLSAFSFALMVLTTRLLTRTESNAALLTYATLGAGMASLPFQAFVWQAPVAGDFPFFLFIGLVGGSAALLIIIAYRNAPAAVVAPFEYTGLLWGSLIGWIVWREEPDPAVWVGAGIIALAGVYITHRETRKSPSEVHPKP